ncbi:hypothetical protein WJX84_006773 [Apatococcus fuscideae]|uniref:Rubisco LSMT substrate-binding domain-containing protein n=1 Tax=Apatococcus fuscideae TaxID=2026836 RepID=A0AAW1TAF6_9CHLO
MQATGDIAAGELVFSYPWKRALVVPADKKRSPFPDFIPHAIWRKSFRGQWPFYGATAVLYESYLGSASGLQAFLELLPDSVDIPRHWGPEDLAAMQYSETAAAVAHSQMQTVEAFEAFTSASEATKNFTFEDFAWACDMLQTRAFGMPILQGTSHPLIRWPLGGLAMAGLGIRLHANRAIKKGEEVLLSYGSKPNAELLLGYGFVQPGNPHDAFRISAMTVLVQDATARGLLRPHWPPGSLPDDALEGFGLAQIGTQGIDADDLEALQQILASHMTSPRGPFPAGLALNDIIAQASWKVFLHVCQSALAAMQTTPQEDERMLREQADLTQRMQDSLQLRLGHKRLLQGCIAQTQAALFYLDTVHEAALSAQPKPTSDASHEDL